MDDSEIISRSPKTKKKKHGNHVERKFLNYSINVEESPDIKFTKVRRKKYEHKIVDYENDFIEIVTHDFEPKQHKKGFKRALNFDVTDVGEIPRKKKKDKGKKDDVTDKLNDVKYEDVNKDCEVFNVDSSKNGYESFKKKKKYKRIGNGNIDIIYSSCNGRYQENQSYFKIKEELNCRDDNNEHMARKKKKKRVKMENESNKISYLNNFGNKESGFLSNSVNQVTEVENEPNDRDNIKKHRRKKKNNFVSEENGFLSNSVDQITVVENEPNDRDDIKKHKRKKKNNFDEENGFLSNPINQVTEDENEPNDRDDIKKNNRKKKNNFDNEESRFLSNSVDQITVVENEANNKDDIKKHKRKKKNNFDNKENGFLSNPINQVTEDENEPNDRDDIKKNNRKKKNNFDNEESGFLSNSVDQITVVENEPNDRDDIKKHKRKKKNNFDEENGFLSNPINQVTEDKNEPNDRDDIKKNNRKKKNNFDNKESGFLLNSVNQITEVENESNNRDGIMKHKKKNKLLKIENEVIPLENFGSGNNQESNYADLSNNIRGELKHVNKELKIDENSKDRQNEYIKSNVNELSNLDEYLTNTDEQAASRSKNEVKVRLKKMPGEKKLKSNYSNFQIECNSIDTETHENEVKLQENELKNESFGYDTDSDYESSDSLKKKTDFLHSSVCADSDDIKQEYNERDLKHLKIDRLHDLPPLHDLVLGAAPPTTDQLQKIRALGITIKSGKFSRKEDAKIIENWKKFIEEYQLPDIPPLFFTFIKDGQRIISQKNTTRFKQFLSQDLDNRTINSVFVRFKRLFNEKLVKKGRFTPEEDAVILKHLKDSDVNNINVVLGKILQRDALSIEKRIKLLGLGIQDRWVRWNNKNMGRFIRCLLKVTKCSNYEELRHRSISEKEWNKLQKKLKFPAKKLHRAWYETIYPRLFIKENKVDLQQICKSVLERMHENGENDWKAVDWKEYASPYEGLTSQKVYRLIRNLVQNHIPKEKFRNLSYCLNVLLKTQLIIRNRKLHKIRYEDGKIVHIKEKRSSKKL